MNITELDKITNEFWKRRTKIIDYVKIIDVLQDMKNGCNISGIPAYPMAIGEDENCLYILDINDIDISKAKEDAEAFEWKA